MTDEERAVINAARNIKHRGSIFDGRGVIVAFVNIEALWDAIDALDAAQAAQKPVCGTCKGEGVILVATDYCGDCNGTGRTT